MQAETCERFTHLVEDLLQLLVGPLQVIVDDDHIKHPRLLTWRRSLNQLLVFDSVCVFLCVCVRALLKLTELHVDARCLQTFLKTLLRFCLSVPQTLFLMEKTGDET